MFARYHGATEFERLLYCVCRRNVRLSRGRVCMLPMSTRDSTVSARGIVVHTMRGRLCVSGRGRKLRRLW